MPLTIASKTKTGHVMLSWHSPVVDLLAACSAFVHVAERGSFTRGAAAAHVPQSVASRRVQALEARLGDRLFDRTGRRPALTSFGRDMVPAARRLLEAAEALQDHAAGLRLRPVTVAVPEICTVRDLAALDAVARQDGVVLEFRSEAPAARLLLAQAGQVRLGLTAAPRSEATWVVPLGVAAGDGDPAPRPFRLAALRPGRGEQVLRRLWLQPEDDVPPVRDPLERAGHAAGLLPAQVAAAALPAAVSQVLRTTDLLLCSRPQAELLGLSWRPLTEPVLERGYAVTAAAREDVHRFSGAWREDVARCLGGVALARQR